jgi:soluble epoxide hydrolase / lipid-phosphate phosphatase
MASSVRDPLITENFTGQSGDETFYLAAGPENGPLVVLLHGWPELSLSWRRQLPCLAALGFRAIAPDMRGYGRSTIYDRHGDYAQEKIVADMVRLLAALGRDRAVWVGHDWGGPVAWNIASHHPELCRAVASLCVPYRSVELGLDHLIGLVDRELYPEDRFPAGQWEYMRFYEENFDAARAEMEVDAAATTRVLFRAGNPKSAGMPSPTSMVRHNGGWFRGAERPPDMPLDDRVLSAAEHEVYATALARNGFFGPNSWYMNHADNAEFAAAAVNDGVLEMPALFVGARYDVTCETMTSRLAEPMRDYCRDLMVATVDSGHWMAQEKPDQVNAALVRWLATRVPDGWPS